MKNARPITDELDAIIAQDDVLSDKMEQIDADIEAQLKAVDCNVTNVLEDYEEIDYGMVDSLEPLDNQFQDIVDDEVDEIITVNDMLDDNEGELVDKMAGID